jgi:hypothetical protein
MATKNKAINARYNKKAVYPRKSIDCWGTVFYTNEKGEYHRTDGPAYEGRSGYKQYYLNGKLHRTDGPAIEYYNGHKEWWVDGKLHRTDGPAIESSNGNKSWWVDGVSLTEEEFNSKYGVSSTLNNVKVEYEVKTVTVPKFVVIDGVKYEIGAVVE